MSVLCCECVAMNNMFNGFVVCHMRYGAQDGWEYFHW